MARQATPSNVRRRGGCAWKAEGRRFDPAPDHGFCSV